MNCRTCVKSVSMLFEDGRCFTCRAADSPILSVSVPARVVTKRRVSAPARVVTKHRRAKRHSNTWCAKRAEAMVLC